MLLICTKDEDFVKSFGNFSLKSAGTTYGFAADTENDENERCRNKDRFDISV